MRNKSREIAYNALIAAVYVCLTLVSPFSFGVLNLRVAGMLEVLGCIEKEYRKGITVGMIIANSFSPYGSVDVLVAIIISIVSYDLGWYIKNEKIRIAVLCIITAIAVSTEVCIFEPVSFPVMFVSMLISETIICVIGYIMIRKMLQMLRR